MGYGPTHPFWEPNGPVAPVAYNGEPLQLSTVRDTSYLPANSWTVIRFIADNPGRWAGWWGARAGSVTGWTYWLVLLAGGFGVGVGVGVGFGIGFTAWGYPAAGLGNVLGVARGLHHAVTWSNRP